MTTSHRVARLVFYCLAYCLALRLFAAILSASSLRG